MTVIVLISILHRALCLLPFFGKKVLQSMMVMHTGHGIQNGGLLSHNLDTILAYTLLNTIEYFSLLLVDADHSR